MKKNTNTENDYLRKLEAKERGRKRKKMILTGTVALAIGSAAILAPRMFASGESFQYRSIFVDELSDEKVRSVFAEDHNRIVVRYPGQEKTDTLQSYVEYLELMDNQQPWMAVQASNQPTAELDSLTIALTGDGYSDTDGLDSEPLDDAEAENTDTEATAPERAYGFNVRGDKMVGEELTVQIVNFDPNITFELDFGNGTTREAGRFTRFAYTEPGLYYIKLKARDGQNPARIYATAPVTIGSPEAAVEENQVADAVEPIQEVNNDAPVQALSATAVPVVSTPAPEAPSISAPAKVETPAEAKPLLVAEKMPSFPGGRSAMNNFIRKNVRYPEANAGSDRVEGKVPVSFIVDERGNLRQPRVLKSLGPAYDREVLRVVNLMPRWRPGVQDGKKVSVYYQILINFALIED